MPPLRVHAPPTGKPGSATDIVILPAMSLSNPGFTEKHLILSVCPAYLFSSFTPS